MSYTFPFHTKFKDLLGGMYVRVKVLHFLTFFLFHSNDIGAQVHSSGFLFYTLFEGHFISCHTKLQRIFSLEPSYLCYEHYILNKNRHVVIAVVIWDGSGQAETDVRRRSLHECRNEKHLHTYVTFSQRKQLLQSLSQAPFFASRPSLSKLCKASKSPARQF